jgi:hypothetical protein
LTKNILSTPPPTFLKHLGKPPKKTEVKRKKGANKKNLGIYYGFFPFETTGKLCYNRLLVFDLIYRLLAAGGAAQRGYLG